MAAVADAMGRLLGAEVESRFFELQFERITLQRDRFIDPILKIFVETELDGGAQSTASLSLSTTRKISFAWVPFACPE